MANQAPLSQPAAGKMGQDGLRGGAVGDRASAPTRPHVGEKLPGKVTFGGCLALPSFLALALRGVLQEDQQVVLFHVPVGRWRGWRGWKGWKGKLTAVVADVVVVGCGAAAVAIVAIDVVIAATATSCIAACTFLLTTPGISDWFTHVARRIPAA